MEPHNLKTKSNNEKFVEEKEKEKKDDKIEDKKDGEKETENSNIVNKSYRREMSIKDWGCKSLDQYEIKKPVGAGTFGTVFKAEYKGPKDYQERIGIPKIVALKKIKTENEKQGFPITLFSKSGEPESPIPRILRINRPLKTAVIFLYQVLSLRNPLSQTRSDPGQAGSLHQDPRRSERL